MKYARRRRTTRAAARPRAVYRRVRRPRKGTKMPLRKLVAANVRAIRSLTTRDTYYIRSTSNIPQNGVYPAWDTLIDPVNWTRTFGLFGTTALEQKDKIMVKSMNLDLRFSLEGAAADQSFKIYCYVVGFHREAKNLFPTGMSNLGFANGQTHLSYDVHNLLVLNREIFRVHKSWVFQLGSKMDGAVNAVTEYATSYRNFSYRKALKMNIGDHIQTWKAKTGAELVQTQQLYLMTFCTSTDDKVTPLANPQLQFQATFTLESAN